MVYANGEPWDLLNGGTPASNVAKIFLTNRRLVTETGVVAPRTLGLTLSRRIVDGLHEDVDLVNYSQSRECRVLAPFSRSHLGVRERRSSSR
jgi:hypothetical protein